MLCGITLFAAAGLQPSCASAPPNEGMAKSAETIRAAQEVGGADVPRAALHIQLAREQAEHARALLEEGDKDDRVAADYLLMRAQADANLALALAREDEERKQAEQALANVRSIHPNK